MKFPSHLNIRALGGSMVTHRHIHPKEKHSSHTSRSQPQSNLKMNTSLTCTLAVCALLAGIWGSAMGRKLHLGSCSLTVHTHELRHHFQQIHHNMVTQDNHKGVRLLRGDMMKSLQATESCCFLRQLLNFYIKKVFSGYTSSQSLHQRTTSVLANSFLSMTKDLRACHAQMLCQCSPETNLKFDAILETYDKLEVGAASVKAIGELDSLLEWLESFHSKDHKHHHHDDDSK